MVPSPPPSEGITPLVVTETAGGTPTYATTTTTTNHASPRNSNNNNHSGTPSACAQDQQVDFVGSSAAVKDLFSLPYTSDNDCSLSVAIHNVQGTLVVDRDPQPDQGKGWCEQPTKIRFPQSESKPTMSLPEQHENSNNNQQQQEDTEISEADDDFGQALVAFSSLDQLAMKASGGTTAPTSPSSTQSSSDVLTVVNSFVGAMESLKQQPLQPQQHPTRRRGSHSTLERDTVATLHHRPQTRLPQQEGSPEHDEARNHALGLPRPEDYVHQHIPPTPEPREYLSWKFHDMRLWVGSDALILRGGGGGGGGTGEDTSNTSSSTSNSSSNDEDKNRELCLTVRVEDANEMQALVKRHDWAVQTGAFLPDHQRSFLQQRGKPSYAAATIKNTKSRKLIEAPTAQEDDKQSLEAQYMTTSHISDETTTDPSVEEEKTVGFSAPNLDEVKLQTCIVPSLTIPAHGFLEPSPTNPSPIHLQEKQNTDVRPAVVSPVSTVLDAYLDNIMANVPQLALCLREKGFIQSVKLLETENIPSAFLHPSTMDTSTPFGVARDEADKVFSPQVMEMNAAALLKFLKLNCTKDNATYLLRRENGQTNIHLYDISSISAMKQRKWIWWLAMMSCRFAHRLRNISVHTEDTGMRRSFRHRERALLHNALELLEVLLDMDGSTHESMAAGVRENLADTFLRGDDSGTTLVPTKESTTTTPEPAQSSPEPATSLSSSQHPYATLTVDALNKAHDHLSLAIKTLFPCLESKISSQRDRSGESSPPVRVSSIDGTSSDESDEENDNSESGSLNSLEVIATATQLFGLHEKIINVSLRLAEIHLRNYYSSSAMQALRSAARRIADALGILNVLSFVDANKERDKAWFRHVQTQYVWLWEHCGHFARSFAGDGLWRDRGHAAADDILIVLLDAESAFSEHRFFEVKGSTINLRLFLKPNPLSIKTNNSVNLSSLSGIVQTTEVNIHSQSDDAGITEARETMRRQKFLVREERKVIIAACLAYQRAVDALKHLTNTDSRLLDKSFLSVLQQRLGDSCNEAGKILLDELRTQLSQRNDESPSDEAAKALLSSAEFWFLEALNAFQEPGDLRNLVLLRCNLCQCFKLRANAVFSTGVSASDQSSHAESCLQEAANHLERAHEALGERATDAMLWDMVSAELAATFLVLGVRRRQSLIGSGNTPMISQSHRLSPGQERSIVEPMDRALKIYENSGNLHQAAAAHYQLALFYSKVWTCQRDETKTREKLAAAFTHYSAAHAFFSQAVEGNELTLCLVCLDLSNLYSSVQGEEGNAKALFCCLDTMCALSGLVQEKTPERVSRTDDWYCQMETVVSSVEERVFKLLRSLVKLYDDGETRIPYKDVYRSSLRAKMMTTKPESTGQQLVLDRLANVYKILEATDEGISQLGLK